MALTIIGTLTDGSAKSQISDGVNNLGLTSVSGVTTIPVDVKSLVPEQSSSSALTQVPAATISTTILPSNPNRKGFMLYNGSNHIATIAYSATASLVAYTFPLTNGSLYVSDTPIYTGPISAIWAGASTGNLIITELT